MHSHTNTYIFERFCKAKIFSLREKSLVALYSFLQSKNVILKLLVEMEAKLPFQPALRDKVVLVLHFRAAKMNTEQRKNIVNVCVPHTFTYIFREP
jgi:hypothetical protein